MTALPSLGPRGEGWVLGQGVLLAGVGVAGLFGPAWAGSIRLVTSGLGAAAVAAGVVLAARGARDLGSSLTPLPHPSGRARLVESGVYRRLRHPIYGGVVLGAVGWGLLTASPVALVLAGITGVFLDLKSRREEVWLAERYPGYDAYRRRTHRFLPGIW